MAASSSTTRQRPNAKKTKKKSDNKNKEVVDKNAATTDKNDAEPTEPTAWETFTGHWSLPFYGITLAVLFPYALHSLYLYLRLERPDLVRQYTGIPLRPAVALEQARPLLIVGTISGATTQVAHELQQGMDLEVCHENSETTRHYCRDGTVSWMHGLRFLPRSGNTTTHYFSLAQLCTNFTPSMGFHPRMYRDNSKCSIRVTWDACWARECLDLVHREWGCAWNDDGGGAGAGKESSTTTDENSEFASVPKSKINPGLACQTPFARTLHQTRHPLRTVESLVSKFCPNDSPTDAGFVKLVTALFPVIVKNHDDDDDDSTLCIVTATRFVLEYDAGRAGGFD